MRKKDESFEVACIIVFNQTPQLKIMKLAFILILLIIMLGGQLDLIKTDLDREFAKTQAAFEMHYFMAHHFAVGVGVERWSDYKNSLVISVRWYASENIFTRFRGLIGANDAMLGIGYSKPIGKHWRIEAMGDFYFFNSAEFAVRGGLNYVIRRR
jgi:hypothetical protein